MTEEVLSYVVTTYYYSSETCYAFQVRGKKALEALIKKMVESGKCDEPHVRVLNSAKLFGTGIELSFG